MNSTEIEAQPTSALIEIATGIARGLIFYCVDKNDALRYFLPMWAMDAHGKAIVDNAGLFWVVYNPAKKHGAFNGNGEPMFGIMNLLNKKDAEFVLGFESSFGEILK